jgi:dTDP-4-dehydrorhamnose 3,5-epimerase-like enzyme
VWSGEIDDVRREALYLPPGLAHGFYSLSPETMIAYLVSHGHDTALDRGIRWDSFGHRWPGASPIVSPRDAALPGFREFSTPFTYS